MPTDATAGPLRLLVRDLSGRRVLARPNGVAGWCLPVLAPRPTASWGPEEDEAARARLGGDVVPVARVRDPAGGGLVVVAEVRDRLPAAGVDWVPVAEAARLGADAPVVRAWAEAAADDDGSQPDGRIAHDRPGWPARLLDAVGGAGLAVEGRWRLLRHWELSAVVSLDASGPRRRPAGDAGHRTLVVKAVGPGAEREPAVTEAVAGLDHAPRLAARGADWHAVDHAGDVRPDRVATASAVGAIAAGALDRLDELAAAGVRDVGDDLDLDEVLGALVAHLGAEGDGDPTGSAGRILAAVHEASEVVASLDLPRTVVHGDAHPGNAVADAGGHVTVLDWTDPSIGCPALDLDLLLGPVGQPTSTGDPAPVVRAWAASLDVDPGPVLDALGAVRLVAAARYLSATLALGAAVPAVAAEVWDADAAWCASRVVALAAR